MPIDFTGPRDVRADLMTVMRSGLPADIANTQRPADEMWCAVEVLMLAEGQAKGWAREARLGTSQGKYTNQHAKDRGLGRAAGETDAALIARLRLPPQAVTEPAIVAALDALITGSFYLFELPADIGGVVGDGATSTIAMTSLDTADERMMNIHTGHLIAVVPTAYKTAAEQVLRERAAAGKTFHVEVF